jgi:hypothetical protein
MFSRLGLLTSLNSPSGLIRIEEHKRLEDCLVSSGQRIVYPSPESCTILSFRF